MHTHTYARDRPGLVPGFCTDDADRSELRSDRTGTPVPIAKLTMRQTLVGTPGGYAPHTPCGRLLHCARRHLATRRKGEPFNPFKHPYGETLCFVTPCNLGYRPGLLVPRIATDANWMLRESKFKSG